MPDHPERPKARLVYSTGTGRVPEPARTQKPEVPRGDGIVRVRRETSGRRGKPVTVIDGLPLAPDAVAALTAELKRLLGAGGTVRGTTIEIQGDHRDRAIGLLTERGFRVKRAGG